MAVQSPWRCNRSCRRVHRRRLPSSACCMVVVPCRSRYAWRDRKLRIQLSRKTSRDTRKATAVQPLDSKGEDSPRPVIFFLLLDPLMELRLVFPKVVVIVLRELHVPRVVPVGCHERAVVAVPLVVVQVLALRVLVLDCQAKPQIFQRLLSIRSHCVSDIVGALDTDPPSQCFDFAGYKEIGDQCMAVIASELTQLSVSFVPPFCGWIKCSDLPCTRRECHPPTQSRVHRVW